MLLFGVPVSSMAFTLCVPYLLTGGSFADRKDCSHRCLIPVNQSCPSPGETRTVSDKPNVRFARWIVSRTSILTQVC